MPIYHIHASGHAPIHRLADFVNEVKPKKLYVVHSAVSEIIRPLIKQKVEVIIQE